MRYVAGYAVASGLPLNDPGQNGEVISWTSVVGFRRRDVGRAQLLPGRVFPMILIVGSLALPVLMLPALALALTVPGAPGGIGLVQFAAKLTMTTTFAGLPVAQNFEETVAAASIVLHLSQLAPEVIAGAISFVVEGLSTGDIKAGQEIGGVETAS